MKNKTRTHLRKCPWCKWRPAKYMTICVATLHAVECGRCKSTGPVAETKEEAMKEWGLEKYEKRV